MKDKHIFQALILFIFLLCFACPLINVNICRWLLQGPVRSFGFWQVNTNYSCAPENCIWFNQKMSKHYLVNWAIDQTGHIHVKRGSSMCLNINNHCGILRKGDYEDQNAPGSTGKNSFHFRVFFGIRVVWLLSKQERQNGLDIFVPQISHIMSRNANKSFKSSGDKSGVCFQARHKCSCEYVAIIACRSGLSCPSTGQPAVCLILHETFVHLKNHDAWQVQMPLFKYTACCWSKDTMGTSRWHWRYLVEMKKTSAFTRSGVVECWTYQFAEWEFPLHPTAVVGALRYLQHWNPLHSSAPQDSRLSARNVTGMICLRFVINITARCAQGRGGDGSGGGGASRLQIGYGAQQRMMPAHKSGNITVLWRLSFNVSATPVHFYAADLYSIPHTDRPDAWLRASGSLERSRSIPATNTVMCKRSKEGGGGEGFCS